MRPISLIILLIINLLLSATNELAAQNELPALTIETVSGQNKISWGCSYTGIKSMIVQRSEDSVLNFKTIGFIAKPKKGINSYTDERPLLGKNYYRVLVLFQSELEWFSNTYKVVLDSTLIAQSRLKSLRTGSTNAKDASDVNTNGNTNYTDFYYEPSTQVYTNPYTGHINISLADAREKRYSISFYDPKKEEVLKITRLKQTTVILDKYNFNARGTYSFKLREGDQVVEKGFVTIY